MPAVLPSNWTADSRTPPIGADHSTSIAPYLQGISFFVAVVLGSAWAVKGLWSVLRRDWEWLPPLSYGRSLSLVVLWGLLFVVVLTMISGARELMTPGAWKKDGVTYSLDDPKKQAVPYVLPTEAERREKLKVLFAELAAYAVRHDGA
ncbi:MAG TPA: hypothetical protein VFB80_17285, partial [Pirellulaceae bacterium]|nr:hypothetical protein [Pirellulaceae bacterium]